MGKPFCRLVVIDAVNIVGGILFMWHKRVVEKIEVFSRRYSVSCPWCYVVDGFKWAFSGVYGPNDDRLEEPYGRT